MTYSTFVRNSIIIVLLFVCSFAQGQNVDTIDRFISIDTAGLFVTRNYVDGQDINYDAAMKDSIAAIRASVGGLSSSNLYSDDGTLAGNRAVTMGANDLNFDANTLVIDGSANNVGIGTASPSATLDVDGTIEFADFGLGNIGSTTAGVVPSFDVSGNLMDNSEMYTDGSGNVGIGTASPSTYLHVKNGATTLSNNIAAQGLLLERDNSAAITIITPNTKSGRLYFGDPEDSNEGGIIYNHATDDMRFSTLAATKMTIKSDGKVGIGTTSPSAKLHISGGDFYQYDNTPVFRMYDTDDAGYSGFRTGTSNQFIIDVDGNASDVSSYFELKIDNSTKLTVKDDGNVGIGKTIPSEKLDVNGNIAVSGTVDGVDIATDVTANQYAPISIIATYGSTTDIAKISEALTCTDIIAENIDGGTGTFVVSTASSGSTTYTSRYTSASTALNGAIDASMTNFTVAVGDKIKVAATTATFTVTLECTR